jgi:hypothetical protein
VPFTGSHPAAVLPLLRTPLPASALVLGSMAPDIPFFLPVAFPWATHTALAVVTSDLLLGAAAWALWHGVLAGPALASAPAPLRNRIEGRVPLGLRPRVSSAARAGLVLVALVVGGLTHVLWDEFTHPRRWGPEHLPALAANWGVLPGYRWLQYGSSVVGGLALLTWFVLWWRRTAATPDGRTAHRWVWPLLLGVGAVAGTVAALRSPSVGAAGFEGATWGGGVVLGTAVVLALLRHGSRRSRSRRSC